MRNIVDVIGNLLKIIPKDETELREKLSFFLNSDNTNENWQKVTDILNESLNNREEEWVKNIIKVWLGDITFDYNSILVAE